MYRRRPCGENESRARLHGCISLRSRIIGQTSDASQRIAKSLESYAATRLRERIRGVSTTTSAQWSPIRGAAFSIRKIAQKSPLVILCTAREMCLVELRGTLRCRGLTTHVSINCIVPLLPAEFTGNLQSFTGVAFPGSRRSVCGRLLCDFQHKSLLRASSQGLFCPTGAIAYESARSTLLQFLEARKHPSDSLLTSRSNSWHESVGTYTHKKR